MDIRRRFLSKKSSGGDSSGTYTVNLNSQWEKTTAVTNPDSSLYDGVYRSKSNYNVHNTAAIMYIDISGLTSFKLYIRSYAESSYDYVMVSQLDQTINNSTSYSSTSLVKAHTRGNQQSGTALSSYTPVEFTGIDGGSHRITVVYRKDGSANSGDDRGYVLIPKSQGNGGDSGGGDVDIDTTYSIMYTSSTGNVVTPYKTDVFGANITSNTYVNGQGIITFDGPVTLIGSHAFYSTSLKSVTIPDSVTEIGGDAFRSCTSLTSVSIGNSVTEIGDLAFQNCKNLTSVTIPDGVTWIRSSAFHYCTSLTSVTIPNSVTMIGGDAFKSCIALKSVTIPDSVTSIGEKAFKSCTLLKEVYCKATTPPTLGGSGVFDYIGSGRKIYVPTASVSAYKSASYWSEYADYIVGYNFDNDGDSSELITFSIDNVQYQAEKGMTWSQWCSSEYNIDGFQVIFSLNWVADYYAEHVIYLENTIVGLEDTILQNTNYILKE